MLRVNLAIALTLGWLAQGHAFDFDISGSLAWETRWFVDTPAYPDQFSGAQNSVILDPELRISLPGGQFSLTPYFRYDGRDDERRHADIREAYWRHLSEDWEFVVGVNRVFWGVAESRHLVDVINQSDAVEDIDEEDKLGQTLLSAATQRDWGELSLYLLPGFRERSFAGRNGRLRTPLPIDTGNPVYESGAADKHVDFAVRYSHFIGDWDIGAHLFTGTGREPRLLPNAAGTTLLPHYDQITQFGTDVQYTREAWLWKLEALVREGQGKTFAAAVAGVEYTLYQLRDSAADLGLLAEYLYDGRDATAPPTAFDNDLFLGLRLALNDTQDTSMLAGVIVDLEDQSTLLSIEAERRLGEFWKLEMESRWFINVDRHNVLDTFAADSHITLRLSRHF